MIYKIAAGGFYFFIISQNMKYRLSVLNSDKFRRDLIFTIAT